MSKNPFENPEIQKLVNDNSVDNNAVKVNNHIHTPFSFSAFKDIPQAVKLAVEENVKVLGINDFFVTHGYKEFEQECSANKVYPVFNVEFIGLHKDFQKQGLRINDPNNPGRIYLSGKGLQKEYTLSEDNSKLFAELIDASQLQVKQMIEKLQQLLENIKAPFALSYDGVKKEFAKELVRERHIATAVRSAVDKNFSEENDKVSFYETLFGATLKSDVNSPNAIEEEIRGKLLKAGGAAFVEEDEKAFLSPAQIKSIISDAGGLITYPLLLDNPNGEYTDFEGDKEQLLNYLTELGIYSIEFIPGRNSLEPLAEYSKFFFEKGFVVSYGTEHNTPALTPLTVTCRGGVELTEELNEINYKSVCVVAAHQYLVSKGYTGYINHEGIPYKDYINDYIKLGNTLIKKAIK